MISNNNGTVRGARSNKVLWYRDLHGWGCLNHFNFELRLHNIVAALHTKFLELCTHHTPCNKSGDEESPGCWTWWRQALTFTWPWPSLTPDCRTHSRALSTRGKERYLMELYGTGVSMENIIFIQWYIVYDNKFHESSGPYSNPYGVAGLRSGIGRSNPAHNLSEKGVSHTTCYT